jgi:hypothetical protein
MCAAFFPGLPSVMFASLAAIMARCDSVRWRQLESVAPDAGHRPRRCAGATQTPKPCRNRDDAAELKLDAEVKAGELLKAMEKRHGARDKAASHDAIPLMPDLGIKPDQSSRWQRIASVPAKVRETYKAEARASRRRLFRFGRFRCSSRTRRVQWRSPTALWRRLGGFVDGWHGLGTQVETQKRAADFSPRGGSAQAEACGSLGRIVRRSVGACPRRLKHRVTREG